TSPAATVFPYTTLFRSSVQALEPAEIVSESRAINSTPEALYAFWKNVENLPRFMSHLESVTPTGERTSHWVAKAPAGMSVEWDRSEEHTSELQSRENLV